MRMAPAMRSFAIRRTAAAASSAVRPSGAPTSRASTSATAAGVTGLSTASRPSGSSRPSTRLASVMVGSGAAAAVADRARHAPALSGPTRSRPAASTRAIEPPPAPTVWTSTIGTWTGIPYSSSSSSVTAGIAAAHQRDVGAGAAHVVGDEVGKPALAARNAAAITPEAGPDITVFAASSAATRAETVPPLPCMTSSSAAKPRSSRPPRSRPR